MSDAARKPTRGAAQKATGIEVGATPRAMLLPPEVAVEAKTRSQRRLLGLVLILVIVAVAGAYAGVTYLSAAEDAKLATAQAETAALLAEQAQYAEISSAQAKVGGITASRKSAMASEIDWMTYLDSIGDTLPQDARITSIVVTSESPLTPLAVPSGPLDTARVAEIVLTASTKDVPDIVQWISALSTLKGFTDATPTNVVSSDDGYQATFTVHVDDRALAHRFDEPTDGTEG
jgi:Tfp pilus assembly protein PilN